MTQQGKHKAILGNNTFFPLLNRSRILLKNFGHGLYVKCPLTGLCAWVLGPQLVDPL